MSLLLLLTGGAAPTTGGFASPVLAPLTIGSAPSSATGGFASPILAPLTIGAVPVTAASLPPRSYRSPTSTLAVLLSY